MDLRNWKGPADSDLLAVGVAEWKMADFIASVREAINKKDLHWADPSVSQRRVFVTVLFANYRKPSQIMMAWEGSPTKMEITVDLQNGSESCSGLVTVNDHAFKQSKHSQRFKFNAVRDAVAGFINNLGITDFSKTIVITPIKE